MTANTPQETEVAMVQCELTYSAAGRDVKPVTAESSARCAVDHVMGEGRSLEQVDGSTWLVGFVPAELEVLKQQGWVELAKGNWTIEAEWP